MGKAKHKWHRPDQPASQPKPSRLKAQLIFFIALLIGCAIGIGSTAGLFSSPSTAAVAAVSADPMTLGTLLTMMPEELASMDVARVNLLCAQGLPGAEKLDIPQTLATLDQWAERVKSETERYLFRLRDPKYAEHYGHSEAKYRAEMLVQVLQEDFGAHYHDGFDPNSNAPPVFKTSKDCFLHGLVNDSNGGNCVSMPVVYAAVGRRLGYPIKFSTSREHAFCRWEGLDSSNPAWRERFNFDAPGKGFSIDPDDFYLKWPKASTPQQVQAYQWLKTLSPSEELALFLEMRGHVLKDNNRRPEAQVAYAHAYQLWPQNRGMAYFLARMVDQEFQLTADAVAETLRQVPQRQENVHWWNTPSGRELDLQEVQRINSENRRMMDTQQQPYPMSPPSFVNTNQQPGQPAPYGKR